jgi:formylglycine-generating enzyme required for sulfatase activity
MKILFCISSFLIVFSLNAQKKPRRNASDIFSKNYWVAIPSTEQQANNFHVGQFEVTNQLYRQFLNQLDSIQRNIHTPKHEGWGTLNGQKNEMIKYYFLHQAFDDYPVNNIDMTDALALTEWLTEFYNEYPKRQFNKVIIRLPTESEWEQAATSTSQSQLPWGSSYMSNSKGPLANYLKVPETSIMNLQNANRLTEFELVDPIKTWEGSLTKAVGSFPKNGYGAYDMAGNVSEFTSTKDEMEDKWITKGGSFAHTAYWCQIGKRQLFNKPNAFTGIRLILEVLEK